MAELDLAKKALEIVTQAYESVLKCAVAERDLYYSIHISKGYLDALDALEKRQQVARTLVEKLK